MAGGVHGPCVTARVYGGSKSKTGMTMREWRKKGTFS